MSTKSFNVILFAACVFLATISQANAIGYTFTDLGLGVSDSSAEAVNNAGQVAGNSLFRATIWNGATPTYLGTLGGNEGGPYVDGASTYAINNLGQAAGNSTTGRFYHAVKWNGTTPTDLGALGPGHNSAAFAINDAGQVAGFSSASDNSAYHATLWNGTTPTDLGTLGGLSSLATGINNSGQVAGYSTTLAGTTHATIWNGTTPTDLGTLGGSYSAAFGINDVGQVVGDSYTSGNAAQHATLWDGTALHTPTDLGTLFGGRSSAQAINNVGQVVGFSTLWEGHMRNYVPHATLWDGATPTNLNNFLTASAINAGWILWSAQGINDNGWIIGKAYNYTSGEFHAFLLTPVPEPETYAMFMAGLGLMGFIARRRKNGQA
jgi:probable HAF family extracellular repeat protein